MPKPNVVTLLKHARKLITPRSRWIKRAWVKGPKGKERMCSLGAIRVAGRELIEDVDVRDQLKAAASRILTQSVPGKDVIHFNDLPWTTHKQVLAAFDAAIKLAASKCATLAAERKQLSDS